jgi:hypothetical protein
MHLNTEQVDIIRDVKKLMSRKKNAPKYICHAISTVISDRVKDGDMDIRYADLMKHDLSEAITRGINSMVSFSGFMVIAFPPIREKLNDIEDEDYENIMYLGRLAWIDWIIETEEIKPEILLGESR